MLPGAVFVCQGQTGEFPALTDSLLASSAVSGTAPRVVESEPETRIQSSQHWNQVCWTAGD